jgi:hypothetical protein
MNIDPQNIQIAAAAIQVAASYLNQVHAHICDAERILKFEESKTPDFGNTEEELAVTSFLNDVRETRHNLGLVFATIPGPDLLEALREFTMPKRPPVTTALEAVA